MPTTKKKIDSYMMPSEVKALDKIADRSLMSRSGMIRKTLVETLELKSKGVGSVQDV